MADKSLPQPGLTISNKNARRFWLAHQNLWPPRKLKDEAGIIGLIEQLGCIQYDTINVVGRNADLVLQARVANYRPNLLAELLYEDRTLINGWDKVACIFAATDWPYFARQRKGTGNYYDERTPEVVAHEKNILGKIAESGPMSSLDFDDNKQMIRWHWGNETRLARAVLEVLVGKGKIGVHHKVGTRRIFDLIERLLPAKLLTQDDPNASFEAYQDWHILRRIGSMGLASARAGEHWLGIRDTKTPGRKTTLHRLVEQGQVITLSVEGFENETLFMRKTDLETLKSIQGKRPPKAQATFLAPLDNFMWNRKLIEALFGFAYTWEVYKPKVKREYGYYVLPVLYGEQFVARIDPAFDRKSKVLTITNWWWEAGVKPDEAMIAALSKCLKHFGRYLSAVDIQLGEKVAKNKNMQWVNSL